MTKADKKVCRLTDRQGDKQLDRQVVRQTDDKSRQEGMQADRQTDKVMKGRTSQETWKSSTMMER